MLVVAILLVGMIAAALLDRLGVPVVDAWPARMRLVLAVALVFIGTDHLLTPERYQPMMPAFVPEPDAVILLTGLCEIAGGVALLVPRLRRLSGICLAVYFLAVLSANVTVALERRGGDQIVGSSRSPGRVRAPVEGRLGDHDRPETLPATYAGLDRLLLIPTGEMGPGRRAGRSVAAIDAAVAAGVGHIVLMSSAGTRAAEEPDIYASYWAAEQRLIRTAPRWTILRMNYYAEALIQEAQMPLEGGVLTGLGENSVAFVARGDAAAAAARILAGEGHTGAIYHATGPERLTGAERAALVAEASGKPFTLLSLTEPVLRGGLERAGLPPVVVGAILSIQEKFVQGSFDIVTGDVERLAGRRPRALRALVAEALAGR